MRTAIWILWFCHCTLVLCAGEEPLLKPLASSASGAAVDGVRLSLNLVKKEFGPGESLVAALRFRNIGEAPVQLRRSGWTLTVEQGGKELTVTQIEASAGEPVFTLGKGEERAFRLDLSTLFGSTARPLCTTRGTHSLRLSDGRRTSNTAVLERTSAGELLPDVPPELAEQVQPLIARLGADDFDERARAEGRLRAFGARILPLLRKVLRENTDAEIRARCERLITELQQTPPPQPLPPALPPPRPPRPSPRPEPPDWEF